MNKNSKNLLRPLIAHYESAEGLQPTVAPLYDPSAFVPSHLSPILMRCNSVVASRCYDRLYPSFHEQRSHRVAVIASVANKPMRFTSLARTRLNFDIIKPCLDQLHLRRGSLLQVYSERSTRA